MNFEKSRKGLETIKIEEYGHMEQYNNYSQWHPDFWRLERESEFLSKSSPYTSKKELINEIKILLNYETKFDKLKRKIRLFFLKISNKFN